MKPNMIVLYVDDAKASAAFYARLTGTEAKAPGANFAAIEFGGLMLGLWGKKGVFPTTKGGEATSEIGFMVENPAKIEALYADWQAAGIPIAQELVSRDFGPTFVALDPDGHRIRVCLFDS